MKDGKTGVERFNARLQQTIFKNCQKKDVRVFSCLLKRFMQRIHVSAEADRPDLRGESISICLQPINDPPR